MRKNNFCKKILTSLLVGSMVLGNIISSFAYTYKDSTANEEYHDIEINTETSNTTVYAEVGSFFKVTIPKHIILSGTTKSGAYTVSVKGDIAGTETISVIPDESFALSSNNLKNIIATINQDKTTWSYNEILENNIIGNGEINASGITAGSWNGNFNFNIALKNNFISVEAKDENGTDLNASATLIKGEEKDKLLNGLIESGYINNQEEVDALINVESDNFENLADTTFNVSNIANSGDTIVILHFNEETSEWEYIGTETVDDNGKVNGNFESYSPVAFIKVDKQDFTHVHKYVNNLCFCGSLQIGATYTYDYTGNVQTFTAPADGIYKLNVYGAQGSSEYHTGGYGAFANGEITLSKGEILYIYVGGQGIGQTAGYNGGSAGSNYVDWWYIGSGGGGTDIRKDGNEISNRIIVAGGGGGGFYTTRGAVLYGTGGNAGASTFLPVNVANTNNGYFSSVVSSTTLTSVYYNAAVLHTASGTGCGGGYQGGRTTPTSTNLPAGEGGTSYVGGVTNGNIETGKQSGNGFASIEYISE